MRPRSLSCINDSPRKETNDNEPDGGTPTRENERPNDPRPVIIPPPLPPDVAPCYICGRVLPVSEFSRDRSKASGRASRCRSCDRERWHKAEAEGLPASSVARSK